MKIQTASKAKAVTTAALVSKKPKVAPTISEVFRGDPFLKGLKAACLSLTAQEPTRSLCEFLQLLAALEFKSATELNEYLSYGITGGTFYCPHVLRDASWRLSFEESELETVACGDCTVRLVIYGVTLHGARFWRRRGRALASPSAGPCVVLANRIRRPCVRLGA